MEPLAEQLYTQSEVIKTIGLTAVLVMLLVFWFRMLGTISKPLPIAGSVVFGGLFGLTVSLLFLLLMAVRLYADWLSILIGIGALAVLVLTAMWAARSSKESAVIFVLSALFVFVLFSPFPNVGRLLRLFLIG